ncbi:MAG: hypothetical protein A2632_00770 [Candidatus Pacebacteria bacterium RIFCSPHIGHO2_01_FULL_46_16]|nr:MAG: hypothetical protein A2632_00770 [Candidatus Pacebacteria bacterium RIFCSPHIGHO2_01_FULL_46_16]
MAKNSIKDLLIKLGLSSKDSFKPFYPTTRDNDCVAVEKCQLSGAVVLSTTNHITDEYYKHQQQFLYWGSADRADAIKKTHQDDSRRAKDFLDIIQNKKYLDVGTGNGGILDLLGDEAALAEAVEPQDVVRKTLHELGYTVYPRLQAVPTDTYDVLSMFHVLEHILEPILLLKEAYSALKKHGTIIVEVPHACDALIDLYKLDEFKKFTFWSEHLLLHTETTLTTFLEAAGFSNIEIIYQQRYPLSNHLYWLRHKKPGGQDIWNCINTPQLNDAYQQRLKELQLTDTIIALAQK